MPASLTSAQLARLKQLLSNSSGYIDPAGFVEGGLRIQPLLDAYGSQGMDAPTPTFLGVIVYPEGQTQVGKPFDLYGIDGVFQGTYEFRDNGISVLAGIAMVVAAAFAFTAIGAAAGGAGTGAGGGAGFAGDATAWGYGEVGEIAAAAGSETLAPLELMSTTGLGETLPYMAGPGGAGAAAAAAGGSSTLSSLVNTGAGLLKTGLGVAATLAGIQGQKAGAGGSQGGSVPVSGVLPGDGPLGLSWPMFGIVALGVAGLTFLIAKD